MDNLFFLGTKEIQEVNLERNREKRHCPVDAPAHAINVFSGNAAHFHADGGEGYKFLGEIISKTDKLNPQLSSRV